MEALDSADMLLLGTFRFDQRSCALFHLDSGAHIPIGSRALGVLGVLVEHAGDLVPKDEIMKAVWPETVVEDANLTVHISTLRRILDSGRLDGSCIQTVSGRGYRFVGGVSHNNPNARAGIEWLEQPDGRAQPSLSNVVTPFANVSDDREQQYPLSGEAVAALPKPEMRAMFPEIRTSFLRQQVAAVALAGLLIIAGGLGWLLPSAMRPSATVTATMASLSAPRLSIVVLPFANLSNDPDQQYFTDGITEDVTTDLSRISDIFVISRNTAFTYKGKAVDAKQIGRELAVRYVLEGSVRRSATQVRVNAQLIDAQTDAHLWAERFDIDTGDLFALQNEITGRIGNTLGVELIRAEAARPTSDPDALDYILRGRAAFAKGFARENYVAAIGFYERALGLDPNSVGAQTSLASALISRVLEGLADSREADIARAQGLIEQVLAASPRYPNAHFVKGQLLRREGRCEEAVTEYETVLVSNPNSAVALVNLGRCKYLTGSLDEAISLIEQAIRLSPRDPSIGAWYSSMGMVHLLQSRTDEAVVWYEKARIADPGRPQVHAHLASAYGLKGVTDRAAAELAEAQRLSGDNVYSSIARLSAIGVFGVPSVRALFEATYFAGLRRAGIPEK